MKYHLDALEFDQVLDILANYAKTDYAKELIKKLTPNSNYEDVLELNNETSEAYLAVVRQGDIPLGGLYNVNASIRRSQIGGILDPNELLNIVYLLDCSNNIIRYFKSLESIKLNTNSLNKYVDKLVNLPTLKTNITLAINSDGKVNDNASRELFTVRRTISSLNNRLKSKLNELMTSKASMLTDNLIEDAEAKKRKRRAEHRPRISKSVSGIPDLVWNGWIR